MQQHVHETLVEMTAVFSGSRATEWTAWQASIYCVATCVRHTKLRRKQREGQSVATSCGVNTCRRQDMAQQILLMASLVMVVAVATARTSDPKSSIPPEEAIFHIINGQDAELGQFPHMAAIFPDGRSLPCGGSLISAASILTAAHCTIGFKSFYIHLGGIYLAGKETTRWTIVSTQAMEHPNYKRPANDVALIFLPEKAPLSKYINLVALPSHNEVDESFVGENVILSGWGFISPDGAAPRVLQWTLLTVISNEACQNYLPPGWLLGSHLCASGRESLSGVCYSDSGSPLVLVTSSGYKQIGITSFGATECDTRIPAGYSRVTSFLDWIYRSV